MWFWRPRDFVGSLWPALVETHRLKEYDRSHARKGRFGAAPSLSWLLFLLLEPHLRDLGHLWQLAVTKASPCTRGVCPLSLLFGGCLEVSGALDKPFHPGS